MENFELDEDALLGTEEEDEQAVDYEDEDELLFELDDQTVPTESNFNLKEASSNKSPEREEITAPPEEMLIENIVEEPSLECTEEKPLIKAVVEEPLLKLAEEKVEQSEPSLKVSSPIQVLPKLEELPLKTTTMEEGKPTEDIKAAEEPNIFADSEEDEDCNQREKFVTERSNIIKLAPTKNRADIPDTLDSIQSKSTNWNEGRHSNAKRKYINRKPNKSHVTSSYKEASDQQHRPMVAEPLLAQPPAPRKILINPHFRGKLPLESTDPFLSKCLNQVAASSAEAHRLLPPSGVISQAISPPFPQAPVVPPSVFFHQKQPPPIARLPPDFTRPPPRLILNGPPPPVVYQPPPIHYVNQPALRQWLPPPPVSVPTQFNTPPPQFLPRTDIPGMMSPHVSFPTSMPGEALPIQSYTSQPIHHSPQDRMRRNSIKRPYHDTSPNGLHHKRKNTGGSKSVKTRTVLSTNLKILANNESDNFEKTLSNGNPRVSRSPNVKLLGSNPKKRERRKSSSREVKPIEKEEDNETKELRFKIEEQKRKRQEILRQKEERRRQMILEKNKSKEEKKDIKIDEIKEAQDSSKPVVTSRKRIVYAPKQEKKVHLIKKSTNSLTDAKTVVIDNLSTKTNSTRLKRLSTLIGPIDNLKVIQKEKKAIIKFKNPAHALDFVDKYHRQMLDLCVLQVSVQV